MGADLAELQRKLAESEAARARLRRACEAARSKLTFDGAEVRTVEARVLLIDALYEDIGKCPDCAGRGWYVGECHPQEKCGSCNGTGVAKHDAIEIEALRQKLAESEATIAALRAQSFARSSPCPVCGKPRSSNGVNPCAQCDKEQEVLVTGSADAEAE